MTTYPAENMPYSQTPSHKVDCNKRTRLIPITTIAGTPRYIPMFSMITDSPSDMTSDSEFALSISDKLEIIGVIASLTASLNSGFSLS
jgi:hypothetical protein